MEVESVAVDLFGHTLKSLLECNDNGEVLSKHAPPSIYMVPSVVRDLSPSSFTPMVVAIGPLHSKDEHLQGFEVQKTTYLHTLLCRLGMVPEQALRECLQEVIHSIERIKACYAGSTTYGDFELAKMMVIDAFFILEFIQRLWDFGTNGTNKLITRSIIDDLLLIENQIPFFVLEIIFQYAVLQSGQQGEGFTVAAHMKVLLNYHYHVKGNLVEPRASNPDHILGFLHEYFRPAEPMPPVSKSSRKRHTAMELDRAGMNFKPNTDDQNWALAMKMELPLPLFPWLNIFMSIPPFSWFQRPTLMMPKLSVSDGSELVFRNLLVYEQSPGVEEYVTAYLAALDMLIDTPEDVGLLVKSEVLTSNFSSNEEAADIINKLCKNIMFPRFSYDQQWEEMDTYYNSYWPNTVAGLKRTYFNNPWSIIALTAAFILFALTIIQTVFTINPA